MLHQHQTLFDSCQRNIDPSDIKECDRFLAVNIRRYLFIYGGLGFPAFVLSLLGCAWGKDLAEAQYWSSNAGAWLCACAGRRAATFVAHTRGTPAPRRALARQA